MPQRSVVVVMASGVKTGMAAPEKRASWRELPET